MLPLISNVLPVGNTSQATTVAATQSAFQAAQAAASASRPLTPAAVSTVTAAFTPQLPERRPETTSTRGNPQPATPQSGRPSIVPDPEFWRLPERQAAEQIAPLPARQQLIDNVQQAVQYTAQANAQQPEAPAARQQQTQQANAKAKLNALLAKTPGLGDSTGHGAYHLAAQRNVQMSLQSGIEASA